jgi:signal transduction histidine kinase/CheY-like chemotaxis protein
MPAVLAATLLLGAASLHRHELRQASTLWQHATDQQTARVAERLAPRLRFIESTLQTIAGLEGLLDTPLTEPTPQPEAAELPARLSQQLAADGLVSQVAVARWLPVGDHTTPRLDPLLPTDESVGATPRRLVEAVRDLLAASPSQAQPAHADCGAETVRWFDWTAAAGGLACVVQTGLLLPDHEGVVLALIPVDRLLAALDGDHLALVHRGPSGSQSLVVGAARGAWQDHQRAVEQAARVASLAYCSVRSLGTGDSESGWHLWAGASEQEFAASGHARQADLTLLGAVVAIASLVLALVVAAHQIRQRRKLDRLRQRDLERARDAAMAANAAKSRFIAVASHEIRTPMNGVLGMTEALLQCELTSEQRSLAETVHESARSLVELTQRVLDLSRIEAGKMEFEAVAFDLIELFEDSTQLLAPVAAQRGIKLTLDLDADLPQQAIGDPIRLRQVVTNLLGNALKFTDHGQVSIHVERNIRHPDRLQVRIVDTGIGMDSGILETLFQPFTQADATTGARFGGAGLGLSISRELIRGMEGTIDVDSTPGEGTVFHFTVRLAFPGHETSGPTERSRGTVMVVDDDPVSQRALASTLRALGAKVLLASQPSTAIPLLEQSAEPIDFLFLPAELLVRDPLRTRFVMHDAVRRAQLVVVDNARRPLDKRQRIELGVAHVLPHPPRRRALLALIARATEHATRSTAPEHAGRCTGKRALVADDNPINRRVARSFLERMGFDCGEAEDGAAALSLFRQEPFDIVVMDWQMPGMDGLEAVRRMRASEAADRCAPVPIIAVTASALAEDRTACLLAGMDEVLTKPMGMAQLRTTVERLLTLDPTTPS